MGELQGSSQIGIEAGFRRSSIALPVTAIVIHQHVRSKFSVYPLGHFIPVANVASIAMADDENMVTATERDEPSMKWCAIHRGEPYVLIRDVWRPGFLAFRIKDQPVFEQPKVDRQTNYDSDRYPENGTTESGGYLSYPIRAEIPRR